MMTTNPHQRYSFADMGRKRLYMFALNQSRISVSVTHDHMLEIESNFQKADKPNAEEWLEEVAADIAKAYGGKRKHLYEMIKYGL